MKFLTIRMKVTLWYAFFMLILILISFLIISELSKKAMVTNQKENLTETVADGMRDLESPSSFEYFENGIYLMLYDKNKVYIKGIIPDKFSNEISLVSDYVQNIKSNGQNFYVYDKYFKKGKESYWMRGVVPQSQEDPIGFFIVNFVSKFLPIFVMVTCLIGYFITKRAFRPVRKIQETAQSIADGNKLFLRIGLPEGKDEIAKLGETVDNMLEKLERSFEKEKQFTSDVSHELRTPITVILTESEYALEHAKSVEELKESMLVINRQSNKMSVLVNQLLFFARSDNNSFVLNKETFEVLPVILEVVQEYTRLAKVEDIEISVNNNLSANLYITVDKLLFIRSLSNIIQNAINYGKPKGSVDISISQNNNYIMIEIKDDGIGIGSENIKKIWDRFYQVNESRNKTKSNNIGLGLSMVKMIMEKHNGYVNVESTINKGSIFTLYFPL